MIALDPAQLVGSGGALWGVPRYAVGRWLSDVEFPLATLSVNAGGSFVLGLLTFGGASTALLLAVGTGACGSFTTFSTFSFETVRLWEAGERRTATANAGGNLLAAGVALALAWLLVAP